MGNVPFFLHGEVSTWEIVILEIAHLGSCLSGNCHLGSCPWENAFGKVPNQNTKIIYLILSVKTRIHT